MRRAFIFILATALCACASKAKNPETTTTAAANPPANSQGLGASSVTPETVAKFAAQPLDPKLASRIQMMFDIRSPGMGMPTEDGKKLFFGWSVSGTPQV